MIKRFFAVLASLFFVIVLVIPSLMGAASTSAATSWKFPAPGGLKARSVTSTGYGLSWNAVKGPSNQTPASYTIQTWQLNGVKVDQFTSRALSVLEYGYGGKGLHSGWTYKTYVWANGGPLAPPHATVTVSLNVPTPIPSSFTPVGVPGKWTLAFDSEFTGTSLDASKWVALNGYNTNNVITSASNVSVSGGYLRLTLASSTSGAEIDSDPADGAGSNGYVIPVGGYVEARIDFPGNGSAIYNWPAFWISGPNWPAAGETDIAEGLGQLTTNYHGATNSENGPAPSGTWSNSFHTYGVLRSSSSIDVYWDGNLVWTHTTGDNGQPEAILLNVGGSGVYGSASQILVQYVRAWTPAN